MRWWEENKEVLVREKSRLDIFFKGNDFVFEIIGDYLWLKGSIELWPDSDIKFPFECKFPKSYPYAPPTIYPKNRKERWAEGHQFVRDGHFCLDIRDCNWMSTLSSVDIIESMRKLVYASIDKDANKKPSLDVMEGIEPTRLELRTQDIRCIYTKDSEYLNAETNVFYFFSIYESDANRIIITPYIDNPDYIKQAFESDYFKIWNFSIFSLSQGVLLSVCYDLIESISYCSSKTELFKKLEEEEIIDRNTMEESLNKNKSKYILLIDKNNRPTLLIKLEDKDDKISFYGCYGIDFEKLQDRIPNKEEYILLSDKKVTIIGCGSGGSIIAENLVKSGVTNLVLIDYEILEIENVFRHSCTLQDIGVKKTYAVKRKLETINPKVNVEIINQKVESITDAIDVKIKDSDLIINAIGNSENLINSYSYLKNIPTIHCKVYPWGFGGEVIRVIPEINPCYECMNRQLDSLLDKVPKESEFPLNETVDYNTAVDGTNVPIPSLAVDAGFIINIASKKALETLILSTNDLKDSTHIILWGNKREWIFTEDLSCIKVNTHEFRSLKTCFICNNTDIIQQELKMDVSEMDKSYSFIIKSITE